MTYSEKLKDPRWQKKRLEIFQRDNFTCTLCGDKNSTLHVHHKEYNGDPWNTDDENLTTLCEECHFLVESQKGYPAIISVYKIVRNPYVFIAGCTNERKLKLVFYDKTNDCDYSVVLLNEGLFNNVESFYKECLNKHNKSNGETTHDKTKVLG